jgi:hypothetical protein
LPKSLHIVLTTVNVPTVVRDLIRNAAQHSRLGETKVWIVGDLKTPRAVAALVRECNADGLETVFLDVDAQTQLKQLVGPFYDRLPFNNECRRNLGYLEALRDGCKVVVALDDDNFPLAGDYIGGHLRTGSHWNGPLAHEVTGFHNVCESLRFSSARDVYPRGFPFRLRSTKNSPRQGIAPPTAKIGVTAGLWLKDPDIDATTWLNGGITALEFNGPEVTVLGQDTWTPLNTQNTSVTRELIPAFLCIPMGWPVPGGSIQRYGDIWGGYFLQALLQGTEFHVAYGKPLVEQRRNPHDYLDDLRGEYWGLLLTDWLLQRLRTEFRPSSAGVCTRLRELADFLRTSMPSAPPWCPREVRDFLEWTAGNLEAWSEACANMMTQRDASSSTASTHELARSN